MFLREHNWVIIWVELIVLMTSRLSVIFKFYLRLRRRAADRAQETVATSH